MLARPGPLRLHCHCATIAARCKLPLALDFCTLTRQRRTNCRNLLKAILTEDAMPDFNSPAVQPTPNKKLVKIFDTEQETEAIVVKGLLESAGIETDLNSLDAVQDTFPGVGGTIILVGEEDAASATKIIEEYRNSPPLDDGDDETAEIAGQPTSVKELNLRRD